MQSSNHLEDSMKTDQLHPRTDDFDVQVVDLAPGTIAIPAGPLTMEGLRRRMILVDGEEAAVITDMAVAYANTSSAHLISVTVRIGGDDYLVFDEPYNTVLVDLLPVADGLVADPAAS
jgi:hypothetical protein